MATIESLDLATLTNNPQSIAEALEDVLEVSSGNIASLKSTAQTDQEYITDTLKPQAQADADTLSDLVDDAPTADVLNLDLTVTNITSYFSSVGSPWSGWETNICYKFMNFVFVQLSAYAAAATLASNETFMTITDSNYYPSHNVCLQTVNHEGETAAQVRIVANQGNIEVRDVYNQGDNVFRLAVNGWYYIG